MICLLSVKSGSNLPQSSHTSSCFRQELALTVSTLVRQGRQHESTARVAVRCGLTCSMLLACVALPCRCSLKGGRSPCSCPDKLPARPERARCSSVASMVSPV